MTSRLKKGLLAVLFAAAASAADAQQWTPPSPPNPSAAYDPAKQQAKEKQQQDEAQKRQELFKKLLALPSMNVRELTLLIDGCDFENFDARDLPYLDGARRAVLAGQKTDATPGQVDSLMTEMHKMNMQNVTRSVWRALADPGATPETLAKALNGYSLQLPGAGHEIDGLSANYLDDARREVMGNSKRKADSAEVRKMIGVMYKRGTEADALRLAKLAGTVGGIWALYAGGKRARSWYRRRKQAKKTPPPAA